MLQAPLPVLSQGGPICRRPPLPVCPKTGLSDPRRAYLSRGGPIRPEVGLSDPRRACLSCGGPEVVQVKESSSSSSERTSMIIDSSYSF